MPPIPYNALFEALELVTAAVVSSSAAKGVWDAVTGLKAKYAAKRALSASTNSELLMLSSIAKTRPLTPEEVKTATNLVLKSISELEEGDYNRVEEALRQGSKSGERRYVQELITAQ